jgi:hypothetical protein
MAARPHQLFICFIKENTSMTKHTLLRCTTLIIMMLAFTALSYGQQRTFVSAQTGNDGNVATNCPITAPCRNFNAAVGVVLAGGEVVALDSGGYGPTTINKSVSLTSPLGVYAAVTALAAGSSAITVTAGSTDTVVLRGLTLTGLGGQTGINVTSVGNLHVEGCVMSGFTGNGLDVALTATGSQIHVKDTISRNNGGSGMAITTTTGTVGASIDNSRSERNGAHGFYAANNSLVTINRSVAAGNGGSGFIATSGGAGVNAELNCEECVASTNGNGFFVAIAAGSTATVRASNSTATNNTGVGFSQNGTGVFESLTNNLVRGNTGGNSTGTISGVAAL